MIEKLRGQYVASLPKGIVIDVNGVGYGLEVPLSTHSNLPEVGQNVDLWVHTYVREDAIRLYGFQHYVDRVAFEILIGLNGVGPKVALAILSTLTVDQLRKAILLERMDLLQNVPGIGKRLAEKIFVELKPKLKKLSAASVNHDGHALGGATAGIIDDRLDLDADDPNWAVIEDVKSALENFGFKEKAISAVINQLSSDKNTWLFQELMKEALSLLGSHKIEFNTSQNSSLDKIF